MSKTHIQHLLILGGTGQIGTAIRAALREQFPQLDVRYTSRTALDDAAALHFDPFTDDWSRLGQCDALINCIGAIKAPPGMDLMQVHAGLTERMIAHREPLGQPRMVQVSALGAGTGHHTEFLRSKGIADELLLAEKDTWVIRPSIVCTSGTMLAQRFGQLLRLSRLGFGKLLVPRGFPKSRVQPILGSDLAEMIAKTARFGGHKPCMEAVGPEEISFADLLSEMAQAQGRKIRLVEVSREIMRSFVTHFVAVWMPGMLTEDQFELLFQDNVGKVEEIEMVLGRKPHATLDFWRLEAKPAGCRADGKKTELLGSDSVYSECSNTAVP